MGSGLRYCEYWDSLVSWFENHELSTPEHFITLFSVVILGFGTIIKVPKRIYIVNTLKMVFFWEKNVF